MLTDLLQFFFSLQGKDRIHCPVNKRRNLIIENQVFLPCFYIRVFHNKNTYSRSRLHTDSQTRRFKKVDKNDHPDFKTSVKTF